MFFCFKNHFNKLFIVLFMILTACQLQEPSKNHGIVFLENRAKDAEAPTSSLIHKGLTKLGHKVKAIRFSSGLALIQWKNGVWHGAADPRREGKATALP